MKNWSFHNVTPTHLWGIEGFEKSEGGGGQDFLKMGDVKDFH